MAWWQKKFLGFCLKYVGIFDDAGIDLDNLDIALGQQSSVELRDVALSTDRLSKLIQLPPGLRVEAAKVLRLKLSVPLNVFSGTVKFEADGVRIKARYQDEQPQQDRSIRLSSSANPQHRKTHRRIGGGSQEDDTEKPHIPTAEEMARSFLLERPPEERKQLEASLGTGTQDMSESMTSESSESSDVGTGTSVGLPGVFAGYVQGFMDRCKVQINDVEITLDTIIPGESHTHMPLCLKVQLESAALLPFDALSEETKREVKLGSLTVDMLSSETTFSNLSGIPPRSSPTTSRATSGRGLFSRETSQLSSVGPTSRSRGEKAGLDADGVSQPFQDLGLEGLATKDSTIEGSLHKSDNLAPPVALKASEILDIQPGDDNITWGSRRNNVAAPQDEGLWDSTENLPDSLLIEEATAPRDRSRSASPEAFRTVRSEHHTQSPLQSRGSWAHPTGLPGGARFESGAESWPTRSPEQATDVTDFVRDLPQRTDTSTGVASDDGEEQSEIVEDLIESRFYTHEEAESMYLSAISHGSPDAQRHDSDDEPVFSFSAATGTDAAGTEHERESETPRPLSPAPKSASVHSVPTDMVSVRVVTIRSITLGLPRTQPAAVPEAEETLSSHAQTPRTGAGSSAIPMPGAFSIYSDVHSSRISTRSRSTLDASTVVQTAQQAAPAVDVAIGAIAIDLDIASCRMLHAIFASVTAKSETPKQTPTRRGATTSPAHVGDWPSVTVAFDAAAIQLHESLSTRPSNRMPRRLCMLQCGHTTFFSSADRIQLDAHDLAVHVGTSRMLSISSSKQQGLSSDAPSDISMELSKERVLVNGNTFTELHVQCAPVTFEVDLHAIDLAFGSFGGISGFLELSSILGESALTPTPSPKVGKGVRFEQELYSPASGDFKANVRVEELNVALRGQSASLELSTSVIKAIYRDGSATATIERTRVTGPHIRHAQSIPRAEVILGTLRIDFLQSPRDQDLERLLSLLTPSKDKYDSDDDILLDTLLRQRKKGSLARISVGDISCKIDTYEDFNALVELIEEMSTLSAMAKYLPEDERPGLLTLLRLTSVSISAPVNERFGGLDVVLKDVYLAHVGLPSLIALSVHSAHAASKQYGELIHAFLPLIGSDDLPMIMARMLGDEAEPVARIKVFNTCVEYSLPTLLALTGLDVDADAEELVSEMAQSIATLNPLFHDTKTVEVSPRPDSVSKSIRIDLLMHDLAFGLRPVDSAAKAAVVLTEAKFGTSIPAQEVMSARLELRKAALFLINDHANGKPFESRHAPRNSSSTYRTATALAQRGYASIASIMSATVCATVSKLNGDLELSQSVRVDVRNELLLLETCADSTQTLFGLLSGLAPPPKPEKQPKYLTQPMAIEDMMASFTGDAYSQPLSETTRETLFDVDDAHEADSFLDDVDDDLLAESDMTSSLYGPVSGMLTGVDRPEEEQESANGDWEGAVESLLEDDPFEMPVVPTDVHLSDTALMRNLNKQSRQVVRADDVSLGLTEFEDLGLEPFGPEQNALGTTHKFNTPAITRKQWQDRTKPAVLPFRLHLRDTHVIWNIYDGYDWQGTRDGISEAVERVEAKVEERKARRRRSRNDPDEDDSVIGDFLFNSIYIGVPTNQDAQDIRRQINRHIDDLASETESVPVSGISRPTTQHTAGGTLQDTRRRRRLKLDRSRAHKVAFELKGLSADLLVMPTSSQTTLQNIQLRVRDLDIFDNVPTSTWRKFLTHFESEGHRREMAKPMISIEVDNVRTNAVSDAAELKIDVTVAPLRLHVDQDALDFITRFFEFKDKPDETPSKPSGQPFIQRLEVNTVDLRLDYKPKHIDYASLRSGHTSEFMNFVTLDGADIRLRHAIVYGIKGFEPLHKTLNDIWMPDIMRNQLPTVLSGLAPVRSLVNLGTGVRDVVAIPVREYRKDGRLVRSIQKGAFHFGKTTAAELARLGAKVALGTQNILQGAEGVLSGVNASSSRQRGPLGAAWQDVGAGEEEEHEQRAISSYANQPLGVLSGLRSARLHLERDLLTARDALIAVQGEVLESSSPGAAAAAVARHAPTLILRPVIGASRAVGTTLLGVGNQIDRGNVRRVDDKYKRR